MADSMKKYTIILFGESYTIISDEPAEDITQAAEYYNQCMEILSEETNLKDVKKLAFLTGLQLSQELLRMQRRLLHLEDAEQKVQLLADTIETSLE